MLYIRFYENGIKITDDRYYPYCYTEIDGTLAQAETLARQTTLQIAALTGGLAWTFDTVTIGGYTNTRQNIWIEISPEIVDQWRNGTLTHNVLT